jgi:hypothetical protein
MRSVRTLIPMLLLVTLAAPAAAHAGGWATVEVGQPAGLSAGQQWRAELLVKQHGITPLDGVTPSVRIANGAGDVRTFVARPAGKPGTYVADVTYPSAGTWRTRIFDGFTDVVPHRLPPIEIAPAGEAAPVTAPATDRVVVAAPSDGAFPWPQAIAVAAVVLMFAAAWMIGTGGTFRRRDRGGRRTAPAAVAGGPEARP